MHTRKLGYTDLNLTSMGLGAWAIGGGGWKFSWGNQDDADSVKTIHRALDLGINWIDTAPVYGTGQNVRDWIHGSNGKWVTMGVASDGSYGIPKDVMYGVPVTTAGGEYTRVTDLPIDDFSREKMNATLKELEEERTGVAGLLG